MPEKCRYYNLCKVLCRHFINILCESILVKMMTHWLGFFTFLSLSWEPCVLQCPSLYLKWRTFGAEKIWLKWSTLYCIKKAIMGQYWRKKILCPENMSRRSKVISEFLLNPQVNGFLLFYGTSSFKIGMKPIPIES